MSSSAETIGKYQIIREIARSNDIVYEAYDPFMNRRVAVKELAIGPGSDQQREERIKRFHREAKAAGMLAHPNIVTIYDVGEDNGRHYIAMEFLDGETLRSRIDRGFLELEEALPILRQILDALSFAHAHNVIHRDIKPDNIQILSDGRVKLTDFDIARLTFEASITMDGQIFGTPSYMSPEQVVGKEIDVRSDLFSVGVVMYEMLSGSKPFFGDSVVTITYNIMHTDPASPPGVPYPFEQIIRRALEKTPATRYQTAQAMIDDLYIAEQQVQQGVGSALAPAPDPSAAYDPYGGYNPYAQPGAYNPQQYPDPYGQPGAYGPQQSPDPYAQQPYGAPPYGGYPYGQTPPNYAYNTPGAYGAPYPDPYAQPAQPSIPWTPPPPPKPLLSPAAKATLGRFFATILICCLVCGMVGVVFYFGRQAYLQSEASKEQARLGSTNDRLVAEMNKAAQMIQQRRYRDAGAIYLSSIPKFEDVIQKASNPLNKERWTKNLANCYLGLGDAQTGMGFFDDAEGTYEKVFALANRQPPLKVGNEEQAAAHASIGRIYALRANQNISNLALLDQAINEYEQAQKLVTGELQTKYQIELARLLLARARRHRHTFRFSDAYEDISRALKYAGNDVELSRQIQDESELLLPGTGFRPAPPR